MFVVSLYDRQTGIPVRSENAETYLDATEIQYRFQDMATDGFGVMIAEGYATATFQGFQVSYGE